MNLGFHSHVPAIRKVNQIYTPGSQGVFLDSLAPYCERLICFLHSPKKSELSQCDYSILSDNIEFVNIGDHASVPYRMVYSHKYTAPLHLRKSDLDMLLIRGPSPLLPAMADRVPSIPKVLILVASYKAGIDTLPQPWWRKELIRFWAYWNEAQQLRIARNSLTFVNSHRLYNELEPYTRNLVETRTTTISSSDFFIREDTCLENPYKILFVGRITVDKGIKDIIKAVSLLHQQRIDCRLDVVGAPVTKHFIEELTCYSETLGVENLIQYHGYKSLGCELNSFYRNADVFITASQSSEGFPRTIWEAFSQSTPVLATKIGSIPFYLQHEQNALLAMPNNPEELALLLRRLLSESGLRKRLIRNGLKLAQNNTLDIRAKEMISHIDSWLKNKA